MVLNMAFYHIHIFREYIRIQKSCGHSAGPMALGLVLCGRTLLSWRNSDVGKSFLSPGKIVVRKKYELSTQIFMIPFLVPSTPVAG